MCKADYYGSSITDEKHFALYIKDTIDDEDAGDGTTMRRWYATMVANGTMVDWEEFIRYITKLVQKNIIGQLTFT